MDILVISNESNILHICNEGYKVDYTFYDSKGHSLDGGVLESDKNQFSNKDAIQEIVRMFKDNIKFSEPFIYLKDDMAEDLLELIQMEDYRNSQVKINSCISTIKNDSYSEIER